MVGMGSIAGRFGNAGQTDYASANEAMAQLLLRRENSLHVDWSGWANVGMAAQSNMSQILTSKGIELLPPRGTAHLLIDMILAEKTEIVISALLGSRMFQPTTPYLTDNCLPPKVFVSNVCLLETDPGLKIIELMALGGFPGAI